MEGWLPENRHPEDASSSPDPEGAPGPDLSPEPGPDPAVSSSTPEPTFRQLHPRVRLLWRLGAGVRAVVWTGAAALAEAFARESGPLASLLAGIPSGWLTTAIATASLLFLLLVPTIRYQRWRYALRDSDLWIRRGILVHRVSVIPYRRLQFVDTRQGPLERWLGLTELVVHTAAPGTSGLIPGLEADEAEVLREALARFAPEDPDEGA